MFFPFPIVLSSLPLQGGLTVSQFLSSRLYIQSSLELPRRLSLLADIVISCSVVGVVLPSRVFLPLQEGPICLFGLCSLSLREKFFDNSFPLGRLRWWPHFLKIQSCAFKMEKNQRIKILTWAELNLVLLKQKFTKQVF